ncbi:MAG: flagellar export protein FliJ [Geobacteraceae bacterium]|nr:flagellar export protein FliJ [Geobacteraceae bacterium]
MADKKFKLEQVLNYRREIEKVRKLDFVSAKLELEHANDVLTQHESHVDELAREFHARQTELNGIEELRRYVDFFARKREEINNQKARIDQLGCVLTDKRDDLLDATRDKKVLESLKGKKAREFRLEMEQKERAFLDEIAIQKKGGPS